MFLTQHKRKTLPTGQRSSYIIDNILKYKAHWPQQTTRQLTAEGLIKDMNKQIKYKAHKNYLDIPIKKSPEKKSLHVTFRNG